MLEVRLSPSRINTLNDCSWSYYCSYVLKLPRFSNDGNRRGNICHSVLECLIKPNHRHYVAKILKENNVFYHDSLRRYIYLLAKKEGLDLESQTINLAKNGLMTHKSEINAMIILALKLDFFGKPGDEIITEKKHELNIDRDGLRYVITGIIDKMFIRKDKDGKVIEVEISDYKTSSKKFDESDLESNLQGIVYQLFVKDMFPTVEKIKFNFLFLRFPSSPIVTAPDIKTSDISGVEHYLSHVFDYMGRFTEQHARKNFAKHDQSACFLCGLNGFKKYYNKSLGRKVETEEPQFICQYRNPFDYYAVIDGECNNVRSAITIEDLKLKNGESAVKRHYRGCEAWHARNESVERDWKIFS